MELLSVILGAAMAVFCFTACWLGLVAAVFYAALGGATVVEKVGPAALEAFRARVTGALAAPRFEVVPAGSPDGRGDEGTAA